MENIKLSFHSDTIIEDKNTIHFDTIITSIGSITKELRVYNHNNADVFTTINLRGLSSGNFRMNIDGDTVKSYKKDVKIPANDSIFIFIELTIDPNINVSANQPFILEDSIEFNTGNTVQIVKLIAYGQNAYFHIPDTYGKFIINNDTIKIHYSKINCNETWSDNGKPHVIYGYVVVEPNCLLSINQGTKVYLHKNSSILVFGGTMEVNGTLGQEVVFQGDRLDSWYEDKPGQWDRIWFMPGSFNNKMNYAIIRNGNIGIHADTVINSSPNVEINNTIIENMSSIGILGQGTHLQVNNTIVSRCGQNTVVCNLGGKYEFKHCTFANFWEYGRTTPSVLLNNYYEDNTGNIRIRDLTQAYFGNCIIDGFLTTEITLDENESGLFSYTFDHCLLKTSENVNTNNYINTKKLLPSEDANFINYNSGNFNLDSISPAINSGDISITQSNIILDIDIRGNTRGTLPDLGALERD